MTAPSDVLTTAVIDALSAAINYGCAIGGGVAAPDLEAASAAYEETSSRLIGLIVGPAALVAVAS